MEFNILKKNRKYYAATKNGYKCKILIDEKSENLELGLINIDVEDISVRSKYGVDLIFQLTIDADTQKSAGICTIRHYTYNSWLVNDCQKYGGVWCPDEKAWIFKDFVSEEIEELDRIYNSALANYEITFAEDYTAFKGSVYLFGVRVAKGSGRDSGAELSSGIAMIEGKINTGGSQKNWETIIFKNTVLRMSLPTLVVEEIASESSYYNIKKL